MSPIAVDGQEVKASENVDPTRLGLSGADVLREVRTVTDRLDVTPTGELTIDGCRATDLVETYGSPLFVISETTLRSNAERVKTAFQERWPAHVNVMFAIKANNNIAVRSVLSDLGLGGDCFSEGEVTATLAGGADPARVAVNGSNKSRYAITSALEHGMLIQLDSMQDLEFVEEVARQTQTTGRVGVRVRLNSDAYGSARDASAGLPDLRHFIDTEQVGSSRQVALEILRRALVSECVTPEGFHFHLGRLTRHPDFLAWWSAGVGEMVADISAEAGFLPSILNIGGGFAREREPENVGGPLMNPTTIEMYAHIVTDQLHKSLGNGLGQLPELWLEPGRYIAGNAGVLLSRVGVVKTDVDMTWVNVDASINDLPRVDNMGWDYVPLAAGKMHAPASRTVDIVGSLCVGRHLKEAGQLPDVHRGDLVAFLDAGAYAETASTQYNAVPRPATVLVNAGHSWVIKNRETIDDLFAGQQVPAHLHPHRALTEPPESLDRGPHMRVLNISEGCFPTTTPLPVRRAVAPKAGDRYSPLDQNYEVEEVEFPVRWLRERQAGFDGIPLACGLLDMHPCVLDFTFVGDETILLVHGAIDVVDGNGNLAQLRTGDMAYFAAGTATTWAVLEPSLELFTILG